MEYSSNLSEVTGKITGFLEDLGTPKTEHNDRMLRGITSSLTAVISRRVHIDGLDSNGNAIGQYSLSYMAVRTGKFGNSKIGKSGKSKGKLVKIGTFTKKKVVIVTGQSATTRFEKIKGGLRPRYNRTDDRKVVLSLSRQMENDMGLCVGNPIETSYGYAIGYQNHFNYQKAVWCEATYKKPILTKASGPERELCIELADTYINTNKP